MRFTQYLTRVKDTGILLFKGAPIAQLDRAPDYESVGRPFESGWARHASYMVHGPIIF